MKSYGNWRESASHVWAQRRTMAYLGSSRRSCCDTATGHLKAPLAAKGLRQKMQCRRFVPLGYVLP